MDHQTTNREGVRIGVLLAGGESRRMGRDKRGLRLGGETLLQRNLDFLRGAFPVGALSVRNAGQAPDELPEGIVVVPDEAPGSPLAGLASILGRFDEPVFAMAADLIAQAEHDPGSAVLVTTSLDLARRVASAVEEQVSSLSRGAAARRCLKEYGAIIVVGGLDEACDLAKALITWTKYISAPGEADSTTLDAI